MDDGCPVCLYLTRVKVLVGQYQLCRFPAAAAWCGAAAGQLLGRHAHMFNSFQAWSPQPPLLGKCVSLWRPHSAVSLLTGPEPVVTAAVATVTVSKHSFPTLYTRYSRTPGPAFPLCVVSAILPTNKNLVECPGNIRGGFD